MTISHDEIRAFAEHILNLGFPEGGMEATIGHLNPKEQMMVISTAAIIAMRQRDHYRRIADLMKEIMHRVEDAPAGCLPDLYQMTLDACDGDLALAIEAVKTGAIKLCSVPVDEGTLQ